MSCSIAKSDWFAWLFGVLLPIAAAVLDPAVFKGNAAGVPMLFRWSGAAYATIAGGTLLLAFWLIMRVSNNFLAGSLIGFGVAGTAIGIVMLPLSVLGLIVYGIGLIGLLPFITSYVFLKAGRQCWTSCQASSNRLLAAISGFGFVLVSVIVFQLFTTHLVNHTLSRLESGDQSVPYVWLAKPFGLRYHLLIAWSKSSGTEREKLSSAYQATFGEPIERAERLLMD